MAEKEKTIEAASSISEPVDAFAKYHHPVLTDAQVDASKEKAIKRLAKARIEAAAKAIEDAEYQRLVSEEGVTIGGVLDDLVEITLNLPPDGLFLASDGRRFNNRKTYKVSRSVANDLMWRQDCGWRNESARKGEDRFAFYQQKRAPEIKHIHGGSVTVQ